MKEIDIIVPCYNEEEGIEYFYQTVKQLVSEIKNYAFTFIFVNDGSVDGTLCKLRSLAGKDSAVKLSVLLQKFWKGSSDVCRA